MRIKKYIPIILGCISVILTGCGKTEKINKQNVTVKKYDKIVYDAVDAKRGDISPELTLTLTADKYVRTSYFPLYNDMEVDSVYVSAGDKVSEGDILISFKSGDVADKIEEYQERIDQNKLLIDHYRKLSELDSSLDYSVDIEQLNRSVQVDNLYISELKAKLNSYSIISEGNGMVFSLSDAISYGKVDTSTNLITVIYGDETFSAETEDDYDFQPDQIYSAYYGAADYNVKLIDIKDEGGKRILTFAIDAEDTSFCSRDKLYLTVEKPVLKDVIYVPENCVFTIDDKSYVYLLDEEGYRDIRSVVVGSTVDGYTIIESGISEGDRVAVQ